MPGPKAPGLGEFECTGLYNSGIKLYNDIIYLILLYTNNCKKISGL